MTPETRPAWYRTLGWTAGWLALALLAGLLLDHPWPALALAAIVALGWQAWRLRAFLALMASRQRPRPRGDRGAWG
ncbi:MAG TPA: phosphate regulon sensor protein PhoR, partial [Luteimonas sp.]|nr:phosphate regulon sensor protein PhoR [Luteimonas sp.]